MIEINIALLELLNKSIASQINITNSQSTYLESYNQYNPLIESYSML